MSVDGVADPHHVTGPDGDRTSRTVSLSMYRVVTPSNSQVRDSAEQLVIDDNDTSLGRTGNLERMALETFTEVLPRRRRLAIECHPGA